MAMLISMIEPKGVDHVAMAAAALGHAAASGLFVGRVAGLRLVDRVGAGAAGFLAVLADIGD